MLYYSYFTKWVLMLNNGVASAILLLIRLTGSLIEVGISHLPHLINNERSKVRVS
jgi:hypothetical protein